MRKRKKKTLLDLDLGVKRFWDKGHPYRPGSGPRGQSCGTCSKCSAVRNPEGGLLFHTCRVTKPKYIALGWLNWGQVDETDPACLAWEPAILKEGFMLVPRQLSEINYHLRR